MSEQKEVLKKYNKGETFTQGGTKYTVYPQLYANLKEIKDRRAWILFTK